MDGGFPEEYWSLAVWVMVVNTDNQASIALAKNPVFHDRSKHIDIQHHYTRELVKQEKIQLNYVPTKDMIADALTKSLPRAQRAQHEHLSKGLGLFWCLTPPLCLQRGSVSEILFTPHWDICR